MAELQMEQPFSHGVIKRGSPPRADSEDGFCELFWVVRESLSVEQFHRNVIIEIDDEHLIARVARLHERRNRSGHFREVRAHAAAVIDDQTYGDWRVLLLEHRDLLQAPILVHAEVLLT